MRCAASVKKGLTADLRCAHPQCPQCAALCIKRTNNLADIAGVLKHHTAMEHTIFGLVKRRGEIAGQHKVAQQTADAIKADLDAIDRALVLCGYEDDPKAIPARGKYKQLFGRNELKLTIINALRVAPADDEAIAARIMDAKGWGEDMHPDVLKRVRDAIQRAQKDGHVVQDFGPDGCLWKLAT